jgi:hypothetical protein
MARFIMGFLLGTLVLSFCPRTAAQERGTRKTENVFIVTIDGMRWQEIFDGADPAFLDHRLGGVRMPIQTKFRYWRDNYGARREAIMPFLWTVVAKDGQIFGDPGANCEAKLTNGTNISYPGYSEMFCGFADPRVDSNRGVANPNPTVLHWLAEKPQFQGKIAAFCTWDIFRPIFGADKAPFPVVAGWMELKGEGLTDRERNVNELVHELPRLWPDNTFDVVTAQASMEYIKKNHPRVCYIGMGETDEWAHLRRYDNYLDAANRNDRFIRQLWELLQSMPQYAGKTSMLITTDHGRGSTLVDWVDHKTTIPGAERVWIAVLGPDTPPMGVRSGVSVTQSQIAATIAALLGEDYHAATPKSAAALPDVTWQSIPAARRETGR